MHELSVVVSLLDLVAKENARHGAGKVVTVHLRLGPLCGVIKEALFSAFELAREGTAFAETELVIEDMPIRMCCSRCQADRAVCSIQDLCCEQCGAPATNIVTGRELEITALEVLA